MNLLGHLSWWSLIGWALTSTALAPPYGSVFRNIKDLLTSGSPTVSWTVKMAVGSPVEQFMSLVAAIATLLVAVAIIRWVNGVTGLEHAGLVEVELTIGTSRDRAPFSQVLCTLIELVILPLVLMTALAATTATRLADNHAVVQSFAFAVGQLPDIVAAVGTMTALMGPAPKLAGLSRVAATWSAFAQFFGGLVELKGWARDLGMLGHHLDVIGTPDWKLLIAQALVDSVSVTVGLVAYT